MRPLIGVTKSKGIGGFIQNLVTRFCLFQSGAKSILLSSNSPSYHIQIDGLLLSGGTDIFPGRYGSKYIKSDYEYDHTRDTLEIEWLKIAKNKKLPIFCICRGLQMLNVFKGGTLHTEVSKVYEQAKYPNSFIAKIFYRKKINILKKTRLDSILNKSDIEVNSMHTQAINELGTNLKISAKEDNEVIQAIEAKDSRYIIGLQFHPEFLYYRKDIRNLFFDFVKNCRQSN